MPKLVALWAVIAVLFFGAWADLSYEYANKNCVSFDQCMRSLRSDRR